MPTTRNDVDTLQAENDALRQKIESLSEQLASGLNKPAFEQALLAQPIAYALAGEADCQQDYQHLLQWLRQQAETFNTQPDTLENNKYHLHEHWLRINAELNGLRERLAASRWPQVRRHATAVDNIRVQVEQHWQQADQALIHQQNVYRNSFAPRLMVPVDNSIIPPPRSLSALHPTYMTVAGDDAQPTYMETVEELGSTPLFLDHADVHLCFTVYCAEANFYRLDLLFGTCLRANPCHLRLIIRTMQEGLPGDVLRVVHFDGLEVLDNQYFPLRFEPLPDSCGQVYWIEVDAPDATPDTALVLWCHSKTPWLTHAQQGSEDFWHWPHELPNAAQQLLLDVPLSPRLHADVPQHLFLLHLEGVSECALNLHIFLLRLAHSLEASQTQAQVWLCGHLSPELMEYIGDVQILHLCPSLHWVERMEAALVLTQTAWADQEVILWNMQLSALPDADLLQQAERLFAEAPQAALLLPVEINDAETILASYAIPARDGSLLFPAAGEAAHCPEHGYRRQIQAAQSGLIILRSSALHQIDWVQIAHYDSLCYQISDLIQQLNAQQWQALHQACLRYHRNTVTPQHTPPLSDTERFASRWHSVLPTHLSPLATRAQCLNPEQKNSVLVVNDTLLEYDQDSASLRLYTLLKLWVQLGYHISFVADNADTEPRYQQALEDIGVEVFSGSHTVSEAMAWRSFVVAFIGRVDIAHRYIPFVRLLSPETRIWYDTVDIHYIREQRQADIENNAALAQAAILTKRKELHNCRMADEVITVTEEDGLHLQKDLPWRSFQVIPNIHTRPSLASTPYQQRDGLVFIGNYHHAPNEDAVYYFVEQVLPYILQQLPQVKFYILGSHLSEKMREWARLSPNLEAIGWVDEVEPEFAQRRVFVSYLRYGAGMKGKLGQAMSLGLPVVTTRVGAEGMGLTDRENACIADEPQAFAQAVCEVYQNETLWQTLAEQGQTYIESHYGESAVQKQLQALLAE